MLQYTCTFIITITLVNICCNCSHPSPGLILIVQAVYPISFKLLHVLIYYIVFTKVSGFIKYMYMHVSHSVIRNFCISLIHVRYLLISLNVVDTINSL